MKSPHSAQLHRATKNTETTKYGFAAVSVSGLGGKTGPDKTLEFFKNGSNETGTFKRYISPPIFRKESVLLE